MEQFPPCEQSSKWSYIAINFTKRVLPTEEDVLTFIAHTQACQICRQTLMHVLENKESYRVPDKRVLNLAVEKLRLDPTLVIS